jgi:TonB family protein
MERLGAFVFLTVMALTPSTATGQQATAPEFGAGTFVDLSYPADALAARVAGTVAVRVTTDASSRVVEAEALSGPALLRPAAVANARQWTLWTAGRFAPAPRTDVIAYQFVIDHAKCNDDSRSLFRMHKRSLATITACTGPGRGIAAIAPDNVPLESHGTVPRYPQIAKSARVTGVVVLDLSIAADGQVTEARVLGGVPLLSDAAIAHAKTWRVRTTSARRGVVVYEFAFEDVLCKPGTWDEWSFHRVSTDHVRLSVCGWVPIDVSGASRESR